MWLKCGVYDTGGDCLAPAHRARRAPARKAFFTIRLLTGAKSHPYIAQHGAPPASA